MRVVCISAAQIPSDTANSIQVMKVCQAFAQSGLEPVLLAPGHRNPDLKDDQLRAHYGLEELFDIEWLPGRYRRLFPWQAIRRARSLGADLLYSWPPQSAVLGLLSGFPSMLELHDFPTGRFGPLWLRLFILLPGRKRLLPITGALRDALRLPPQKTVVSPDGVDIERYVNLPPPGQARSQLGLPPVDTVLCTGHLYAGRGVELFLTLAERFPQASFVWVGGRPDDVQLWKGRSANQANVIFTGFVPNLTIPLYQAAADILLMPYERTVSTSSGGNTAEVCSPMKMFEYMAAGRAILSSDLAVLHEVLDDSTASFCPLEQPEAWVSALGELLANPNKRRALGQSARIAAGQYTWTKRVRRDLEGFYEIPA